MPTFTVTAEPSHIPPRVRLDFDTEVVGSVFTEIVVRRDGSIIRSNPPVGSQVSVAYDYDAPFGVTLNYTVNAQIADAGSPDWTESWASLAAWTGDTADWSTGGGEASSSVYGAAITRTTTGTIARLEVSDPTLVRIELLDAGDVVVCSVECGDNKVTLGGAGGYSQVVGSGTFALNLSSNYATVVGTGWSVARAFTGTPTKVRLVGLIGALQTASWSTTGTPDDVAIDSAGNVYLLDDTNDLVRKFTSAGSPITSWSTTNGAGDIAIDASNNVYVTDPTAKLVRKYNSSGTPITTWSTTGSCYGIAIDGSGNVYVTDYTNKLLRKYNSSGTPVTSWSTTGSPEGVAVDGTGNVYVADISNKLIRKYSSAGTGLTSWSTTGNPTAIELDTAGNLYVADSTNKLIRKFTSAGSPITSWSTGSTPGGLTVDAADDVFITDIPNKLLRKYENTPASIGAVSPTLDAGTTPFNATDSDTLAVTEAWLIHPSLPDLSISIDSNRRRWDGLNIEQVSGDKVTRPQKATVIHTIGRERPVVVTNGNRGAGEWSLVLFAPRTQDRDAVDAITLDQAPLLFRMPPSFDWDLPDGWYSVADTSNQRVARRAGSFNYRDITLPLTPVDPPPLTQGAEWTCADVLLNYATCADVLAAFDTCLDLLIGP